MLHPILNTLDKAYCHAIAHCEGQWLSSAYTLIQTAFVHQESTNPHVAQHAHKIQTVFNIADIGWVGWGIKAVIDELKKKYDITIFKPLTSQWNGHDYLTFGSRGLAAAAGISLTAFVASSFLNKYFQPYKDPRELLSSKERQQSISHEDQAKQKISITFEPPDSQLWAQRLFIVRIISNIGLACLSSNRALPICTLLGQTYSLMKLSQLKWLNFSRLFSFNPGPSPPRIKDVKISYRALLTPFSNPTKQDICALCHNENPTSYFCSYHSFHDSCLSRITYTKSDCFAHNNFYLHTKTTSQYGTSTSYQVSLDEINLPKCPFDCNERYPDHAYFDVLVNDLDEGRIAATVNITDRNFESKPTFPRFFEALNLAYNAFQTSLAYTQQRHPELTRRILNTQIVLVLLVADAMALARDYVQLQTYFKERKKQQKDKNPNNLHFMIAAVASSLFAAAGVFWMSRYLKPSTDLKGLLKTAGTFVPKELDSVNVYWSTPPLHKLGQFLALNRIAVNLFSAFVHPSRKSFFHLTTASLQALTLHKISQLPWIKFEKTFTRPDGSLWSSKEDQQAINQLTVETYFLPQSDALPSTLKSIYDYTTNFFNRCNHWKKYWHIRRTNGVETSRTLVYDVTVYPDKLQGDKPSYIGRMTAWAIDRAYGYASVNLSIVE